MLSYSNEPVIVSRPTHCPSRVVFIRVQSNLVKRSVISGFRRDVDEMCALLGCYAVLSGNPLPTFRDNVSVPSSRVKKSNETMLKDVKY
jgi:hypothetical protein